MEFRVTLDREAFKVLASDTRLDILKALDERPMTVSELGRKLELNKATVFEHLEKLASAGLVKKADDEERKWVYYSLSWKARRILHPERVTIALLFSSSLAALASGVTVAAEYFRSLAPGLPGAADDQQRALGASPTSGDGAGAQGSSQESDVALKAEPAQDLAAAAAADPTLLYIALALFVLVTVLAVIGWYYWRQAQARDAREAAGPASRGSAPPPGA